MFNYLPYPTLKPQWWGRDAGWGMAMAAGLLVLDVVTSGLV